MPFFSRATNLYSGYDSPGSSLSPRPPPFVLRRQESSDHSDTTALPPVPTTGMDRGLDSRRGSVLGLRAVARITEASQRVFSSTPVTRSPSVASSRQSSKDTKSLLSHESDRIGGFAKSLLMHGKRIKRSASKLSLASTATESEHTVRTSEDHSMCPTHGYEAECDCKYIEGHGFKSISYPFGFKHVTHSQAQHFRNLDRTNENDLVAEYSAVRAAQASRPDLRGIKAEALHSRNSSTSTRQSSPYTSGATSPHLSAVPSLTSEQSQDSLHAWSVSSHPIRYHTRGTRSRDSFSQPFITTRLPAKVGDGTIVPPPRTSSKTAFTKDNRAMNSKDSVGSNLSEMQRVSIDAQDDDHASPSQSPVDNEQPQESPKLPATTDAATEPPPPYTFTYTGMLSPVSEEEASLSTPRQSLASQVLCDDSDAEDLAQARAKRVSASRTNSQTSSIRTIIFAPNQTSLQKVENATPPSSKHNSLVYPRNTAIKRSSASNGLFSSWDDDTDISDTDGSTTQQMATKDPKNNRKREPVVRNREIPTIQTQAVKDPALHKRARFNADEAEKKPTKLPVQTSHGRNKSDTKPATSTRPSRGRGTQPTSSPPKSKLPAIPSPQTPRSLTPNTPRSLTPTSPAPPVSPNSASKRSKIPVKQDLPQVADTPVVPSKSAKVSRSLAVANFMAEQNRIEQANRKTGTTNQVDEPTRKRTASDASMKRPSHAPRSRIPTPDPTSVPPVPRISKHSNDGTTYALFPSPS